MANFGHFSRLAILANVALAIIWSPIFSIWVSFRRAANLQITSENGIKKKDSNKKLWPKQNLESKNGHFPLYFWCILDSKVRFQRHPFQLELRADSYIFGISRAWRMGAACMVIENQTFCIYAPPPIILSG